jgi:uncharacterized membrane protein YdbT with pleckstrin-like domain
MSDEPTVLVTTEPSIKPTLIGILGVLVTAAIVIGGVFTLGGNSGNVETIAIIIGVVALLVVLRLLVRMYILKQTTYTVTDRDIRREYAFLFRRSAREVPLQKLRGLHLSQTPLQMLFGYGNLQFLTAGQNDSLGFISFDNVPSPVDQRETIRGLIEELDDRN